MYKIFSILFFSFQISLAQNYAAHVDPFIGTGGHGHTFPGATMPFGMVQLSPDTRIDGTWDGNSGYHYDDKRIYGFSHTHLSGTGCSDWGDILLMPTIGEASVDNKIYSSEFSHKNEKAKPGYYEVTLDKGSIKAELTVTPRVGIHRYTFPKTKDARIVLDLLHRDRTLDCMMTLIDSNTVTGWRVSEAWAKKQTLFYAIKFSKAIIKSEIASNGKWISKHEKNQLRPEQAVFSFKLKEGELLIVKVGISAVSVEGALKNLDTEASSWDFEKYKKEADNIWNAQLSKIEIKSENENQDKIFYTALYHCMIHPSLNMDVDGQYRGRDNQIHFADGFTNYSVFSLWDTYRALHPLFCIIEAKRTNDFIRSFLVQYQQGGRLPVWELSSNETECMIGFHAVSVIADAYQKGIKDFDLDLAFTAMKSAASYSGRGVPEFNRKHYLQVDDVSESVSRSLEYAYDNWCVAQFASAIGKHDEGKIFMQRSLAYKNLFDPSTGFMRPRKNGNWLSPFDPTEINNHFTEGNSWQYSFYVPHDLNGLINMHGGAVQFEKKLDELFTTSSKTTGREQADVTGLIGQYAHGNEPSHHMAYLYNYLGHPEKTQTLIKQICSQFYTSAPDGLIGNEDCGQMSAWYVCSTLGFYPVCPGSPNYVLTVPQFKQSKINFESGKTLVIKANQTSTQVWTGIKMGERNFPKTEVHHALFMNGGTLDFEFSDLGSKSNLGAPMSEVNGITENPAPLIISKAQVFADKQEIKLSAVDGNTNSLVYTMDGSDPNLNSTKYAGSFVIDTTTEIKVRDVREGISGTSTSAKFYKIKYNYKIDLNSKPKPEYAADGEQTLIDGIEADKDWRKGNWLGFQGIDFECSVDLKWPKPITHVGLICLQETQSWILYPTVVEIYGSLDNSKFDLIGKVQNSVKPESSPVQLKQFAVDVPPVINYRYLRVVARYAGKLPDWHAGAGEESYIFVSELDIR